MNFTDYDVLSFDCYGTLIDWEAGITAVLGPWARRHQPDLTDEDVLVAYSDNEAEVEAAFADMVYSDVLQEAFRRTGAALGFEVNDADAAALGSSVGDWPAFHDSAEALARLKQHCRLIILSNVHREGFAASNRRLGVEFDAILTAQDIGSYKPNPANFDALLAKADEMGVPEGRLLHDHVPAKARGLPSVWINRRHDQAGWGATPDPGAAVSVDAEYPSMAAFADAVDAAFEHRT
jgi:2-haloacid dehalogenase